MVRCLLLVLLCCSLQAEENVIRVLGIGNSFTNNAFQFLDEISAASPTHRLELGRAVIGGCSLERHVRHFKEHEDDPDTGLAYGAWVKNDAGESKKQRVSLQYLLRSQPWDVISIQQVSKYSTLIETYQPYAGELLAYIKKHAPQATVMLHQTWAYRVDGDFDKVWPDKKAYDQEQMYKDSAANYQAIADELGLKLIPVGAAFQLARERQPYVPVDVSTLKPGDKIPQRYSLNSGYYWKKGKLRCDSHHASKQGCVLAGLVWFATLTGEDVTKLDLNGLGIEAERLQLLQQVASDVANKGVRPAMQPE